MTDSWELSDEDRMTLEMLAETFLPPDGTNDGLRDIGFSGIIEMRNKYQPALARIYATGIDGINQMSLSEFGEEFVELSEEDRNQVVGFLLSGDPPAGQWTDQESPVAFFENIKMDACFVYGTSEEVWEQIGFTGPSFTKGGHPDYDQPQD